MWWGLVSITLWFKLQTWVHVQEALPRVLCAIGKLTKTIWFLKAVGINKIRHIFPTLWTLFWILSFEKGFSEGFLFKLDTIQFKDFETLNFVMVFLWGPLTVWWRFSQISTKHIILNKTYAGNVETLNYVPALNYVMMGLPSTWYQDVPGTWYRVPGTRYQVPGNRYLVPGNYLVPNTW